MSKLLGMKPIILLTLMLVISACINESSNTTIDQEKFEESALAIDVIAETARTWESYKKYAWGHDVLAPLSKSYKDWYAEPLYISPIDAYSTLYVMGLKDEASEIEQYVIDSLDFNKDIEAKIFEVNIRILGGLLSMYELSGNDGVLAKAKDFADRMLPAFNTSTGIPKYWVNLSTGETSGDTVNVAEAASYTMEMGVLSYYTKDPKYYQAGKKATMAIFARRSELGLIGDVINVETGQWVSTQSHICAGVDSYYEYMYKSFLLFGDPDLGKTWEASIARVHQYLTEYHNDRLWYGRADMNTGDMVSAVVTLYDAFFPAILTISGDTARAIEYQQSWAWLWNKYGLEPMVYDYKKETPNWPVYDLNPEIIESAYYLFKATGDSTYYKMNENFWADIKTHCRTAVGFTAIQNVETMEQKDYMPTFFFAETLKYLYFTFSNQQDYKFDELIFTTEAHPFRRANFNHTVAKERLGFGL